MTSRMHAIASTAAMLSIALCACGPASVPQPPVTPNVAVVSAPAIGPCDPIDVSDSELAAFLAIASESVARAGERIGRRLCVEAFVDRGRTGDGYVVADLVVRDERSGETGEFRARSRRAGRLGPWESMSFLESHVAEELALTDVARWLEEHSALRSVWRRELVRRTSLAWLRWEDRSALCLELPSGVARCWEEEGDVARIAAWDWSYEDDEVEEHPRGFVSVVRPGGDVERVSVSAIRTSPGFERASADREPQASDARRPTWARERIDSPAHRPMPRDFWGPMPEIADVDRGPFVALEADPFDDGPYASFLVVRTELSRRVCARFESTWRCSAVEALEESGQRYRENRILDAFAVRARTFLVVRATLDAGGDVPGTSAWGDQYIDVFDVAGDHVVRRGSLAIGAAHWRSEPDGSDGIRRVVDSVYHPVYQYTTGCVRIGTSESRAAAITSADFTPRRGAESPLALARASEVVSFVSSAPQPGSIRPFADYAGLWELTSTGFRRIERCPGE
jgi:hypothetical protein